MPKSRVDSHPSNFRDTLMPSILPHFTLISHSLKERKPGQHLVVLAKPEKGGVKIALPLFKQLLDSPPRVPAILPVFC